MYISKQGMKLSWDAVRNLDLGLDPQQTVDLKNLVHDVISETVMSKRADAVPKLLLFLSREFRER